MSWIWLPEHCNKDGPVMRPETGLGPCWEWKGRKLRSGYGVLSRDGRTLYLHRMAWEFTNGKPVPERMMILHYCDNPTCIKPSHLYVGTHADNMRDARERGRIKSRQKTHCKRGHPLYGDNLVLKPTGGGREARICKECRRQSAAKYRSERRNG